MIFRFRAYERSDKYWIYNQSTEDTLALHGNSNCKCTLTEPEPGCYAPITEMSHRTTVPRGIQVLRDGRLKGNIFTGEGNHVSVIGKMRDHLLYGKRIAWFRVNSPAEPPRYPLHGSFALTTSLPVEEIVNGSLNAYVVEFRDFKSFKSSTILITRKDLSRDQRLVQVVPGQIGNAIAISDNQVWALQRVEGNAGGSVPLVVELIFMDEEEDVLPSLYRSLRVEPFLPSRKYFRSHQGHEKYVVFLEDSDERKTAFCQFMEELGKMKALNQTLTYLPHDNPRTEEDFEENRKTLMDRPPNNVMRV